MRRILFAIIAGVFADSGLSDMERLRCSDWYGVNWNDFRANVSFWLDRMMPSHVYFDVSESTEGIQQVAGILRESHDAGSSCFAATSILKLIPLFRFSTKEHDFMRTFAVPPEEQGIGVRQILAFLQDVQWSKLLDSDWSMFRLIARFRRATINFLVDMLQQEQPWAPMPKPGSMAEHFLAHVQFTLENGGKFSPELTVTFLHESGALDLDKMDGLDPPYFPTGHQFTIEDAEKLNRILGISVALIAAADIAGEQPRHRPMRDSHVDSAYELVRAGFDAFDEYPFPIFASRWPLFEMLDRLECKKTVRIPMRPASKRGDYYSVLFPFREKVSNYVRNCKVPYCDHSFFEVMEALRNVDNLRLVEVGGNLGDCSLWAASMYDIPVVAFEPLEESAAVFRQAASASNLDGHITIHETALGESVGTTNFYRHGAEFGNAYAWAASTNPYADEFLLQDAPVTQVNVSTLDELVPVTATSDVIKIWAYGDTLPILRAGRNLWGGDRKSGNVAAMFINFFPDYLGSTENVLAQMTELWSIFAEAGLIHIDCPSSNVTISKPEDVLPLAKLSHNVFTLVASRYPASIAPGSERDLMKIGDGDQQFEATRTLDDDIWGCGFSPSKSQEERLVLAEKPLKMLTPTFL
eukprot:gene232-1094_t